MPSARVRAHTKSAAAGCVHAAGGSSSGSAPSLSCWLHASSVCCCDGMAAGPGMAARRLQRPLCRSSRSHLHTGMRHMHHKGGSRTRGQRQRARACSSMRRQQAGAGRAACSAAAGRSPGALAAALPGAQPHGLAAALHHARVGAYPCHRRVLRLARVLALLILALALVALILWAGGAQRWQHDVLVCWVGRAARIRPPKQGHARQACRLACGHSTRPAPDALCWS